MNNSTSQKNSLETLLRQWLQFNALCGLAAGVIVSFMAAVAGVLGMLNQDNALLPAEWILMALAGVTSFVVILRFAAWSLGQDAFKAK